MLTPWACFQGAEALPHTGAGFSREHGSASPQARRRAGSMRPTSCPVTIMVTGCEADHHRRDKNQQGAG